MWKVAYRGHEIVVTNAPFRERLIVDGEIQEEQTGMTFTRRVLHGQIKSGDGAGENIKVYIMAGFLTVNCIILIDGREVLSA